MKKFYTLMAAAAVALGASAAQRATADYAQIAKDAKVALAEKGFTTSAKAQLKGAAKAIAAEDIVGTNFMEFYVVGQNGWSDPYLESFEIVAGANPNEYVIKNLIWGSDAYDLNATYSTITEQGQTFELLTIAGGQDWFVNSGQTCKLGIGYASPSTGDFGGNLDSDAEFLLVEENGEKLWVPSWGFNGTPDDAVTGLVWGYKTSETQWRGNVFPGCYIMHSNGTFTGEYTEDGQTFEEETYGIYAVVANRFGKQTIQIYNVGGGESMTLKVVDGIASGTDQVLGNFYTDQTMTTTTPVYYFNGEDNSEMLVSGNVGTKDGKSYLDFGALFAWWPGKGWGFAWNNAIVNFDNDYGFVEAGINNVSADFDENAPVEYFNLQGVRVENPGTGLYIKRQGNKVAKVIL